MSPGVRSLAVAAILASVVAWPTLGRAATPAVTAQAQQANAAFLAYAPPPVRGPGALCLVDTGVNANPDTAPGLIGSYAIDSGPTGDVDPQGHGTSMAMIAGAAGNGMIGVWPQLKIVSVRATDVPSPGQEPAYEFDNYWQGMNACLSAPRSDDVKVVDLALASGIPPSPDQVLTFATAVSNAHGQNIAIVTAAGNAPGSVEEPGAEPGVLSVGAATAQPGTLSDTATGSPCSFSATGDVVVFAPGCGLNAANPVNDAPFCCADGTSDASAFTAAVLVALMSYDPALTYNQAEQLLVSTAQNGDMDVAAAFDAAGLGEIVRAGAARVPQAPVQPAPGPQPTPAGSVKPPKSTTRVAIKSVRWRRGILTIRLTKLPNRAVATVTLQYAHRHSRTVRSRRMLIRIRTRRPLSVVVGVRAGRTTLRAPTKVAM